MLIVFDDMIADMESNEKYKFYCYWTVFERKKAQDFPCLYLKILFQTA